MAKVRLELGAELDTVNRSELAAELHKAGAWQREAAQGLRHFDLPILKGNISGAAITLGGDQTDGQMVGPNSGFYWRITRISVDGLAAADVISLYKGGAGIGVGRFITKVVGQPGTYSPGKGLVLKPSDFLSITGSGLTATGEVRVTGEGMSVPGPLMWKILS